MMLFNHKISIMISIMFCLVVSLLAAVPAFASANLEISGDTGKYRIYCLLTGDPANPDSLSFASTSFPKQAWDELAEGVSAPTDAAAWLDACSDESAIDNIAEAARFYGQSFAILKGQGKVTVPAGYYVITSTTSSPVLVSLSDDTIETVQGKVHATPVFKKRILINSDSSQASYTAKRAEIAAGRPVSYHLSGTLPPDYDDYSVFYYAFEDEIEDLELARYEDIDFKVSVSDEDKTEDITDKVLFEKDDDKHVFKAEIENLKDIVEKYDDSTRIELDYTLVFTPEEIELINGDKEYAGKIVFGPEKDDVDATAKESVEVVSYILHVHVNDLSEQSGLADAYYTIGNMQGKYYGEHGSEVMKKSQANFFKTNSEGNFIVNGISSGSYILRYAGHQGKDEDRELFYGKDSEKTLLITSNAFDSSEELSLGASIGAPIENARVTDIGGNHIFVEVDLEPDELIGIDESGTIDDGNDVQESPGTSRIDNVVDSHSREIIGGVLALLLLVSLITIRIINRELGKRVERDIENEKPKHPAFPKISWKKETGSNKDPDEDESTSR